jgi:UPF0755 protein
VNRRLDEPKEFLDWSEDPWDDLVHDDIALPDFSFEKLPPSGRGWRWVLAIVAVLVVTLAIAGGLAFRWVLHEIDPPGEPGGPVAVTITDGMTVSDVAETLEDAGVIGSARVFRWYVSTKDNLTVQAGVFRIPVKSSFGDIVKQLSTPPEQVFDKVTFPEGFTLAQIAARLHDKIPRLSAERFLELAKSGQVRSSLAPADSTNLEGLLFPDTYQIATTEDEARVLARMVDLMDRIAGKEQVDTKSNPYDIMIIASLIEREAKVPEDRAKIARVIYNRLFQGMTLDIDAALLYGTPGNQTAITDAMKQADSPYNLYKVKGLPPTPIASPSRASIDAAMNPADGYWLYYVVADASGRHVFADTYEEHLANVAKSRAAGLLG